MKKHLLFTMMLASGTAAIGQTSGRSLVPVGPVALQRSVETSAGERNMTCADTLQYAIAKEYAFAASPVFYAAPLQGPGEEQSQAFISTETVNVLGVNFRARVNSANPTAIVPVMAYLYTVDAAYKPLARIDSALVNVSTTAALYYNANFITPHPVTGNYAVAIRPTTLSKIDFIVNNRTAAAGGEALSYNKWAPASGANWFANGDATNGWGQDFDALISPIVSYAIATDYTVSPSSSVCLGTPMTFTNTTTPGANLGNRMYNYNAFLDYFGGTAIADSTYAWDMGNSTATMWSTNASYTYPAAGTYTTTLYTIGGFWTTCLDTKAATVTVNALDDATITAPTTMCSAASSVTLTAPTAGGTWTGTGVDASGVFNPATAGVGTHSITYTTMGACPDTDNVSITVTANDDVTISGPATVCEGSSAVTLTAPTAGGMWTGTGVSASGSFDPTTAGVGTHTITYATSGACANSDTYSIDVIAMDDATITSTSPVCENSASITLTAATTGGTWSGTGVNSAGTFDVTTAGAGSHTITYTTAGACPDTDTEVVIVNATEDATITDPGMLCDDDAAVNLVAATTGGTWSGTGVDAAGSFDPATAGAGTHVISYTTAGTCAGTDNISIVVSVCTGINESNNSSLVSVYPSPSTGVFTVNVTTANSSIEVFNMVGKRIYANAELAKGSNSVDLTGFADGAYFVKVVSGSKVSTQKIVISK